MVLRNHVNRVSGWLLGYGGTAGAIAADPLALFIKPTAEWGQIGSFSIGLTAVLAFLTFLAFTFFAKPYVRVQGDIIEVENPFKRWTIQRGGAVIEADAFPYPYIRVQDRRVWLIGLQRSLGSMIIGRNIAEPVNSASSVPRSLPTGSLGAVSQTSFSSAQLLLAAIWIAYAVLGLIAS